MKEVIEYHLVTAYDTDRLDILVNDLIKLGFQPFGTISVTNLIAPDETHIYFAQPMVKFSLTPQTDKG